MKLEQLLKNEQKKALSLGKEESAVVLYMMHITGYSSSELYIHMHDKVTNEILEKFKTEFSKYLYDNVPIQYIIGYQTFYGYDFDVDDRVLIPRYETEELVENVLLYYDEFFYGKEVDLCDIGTGSGAIAISLAKEEDKMKVVASDISREALEVAQINNQKFNANVTFLLGSMVEPLVGKKFDIIVSNPPYIPNNEEVQSLVKDNEPISEWNIKNIHQLILKDIDNENAGRYRKENVTIKGATHIPPDYLKIPELMEKLILTYNTWREYHPIIQAALLHGELVKIHPFVDGNGRTSRLLMNLDLMNSGYNPVIIKKESRLKYYEALDKAHTTCNYTDFVKLVTKLEIEILNKYLSLL